MGKGKGVSGWVTALVLTVWLAVSYPCAFLGCARILSLRFFSETAPDDVGRYVYLSENRTVGESLHVVFWPCVALLEEMRWALYLPRLDSDFYEHGAVELPVPTGWEYLLEHGGEPFFWVAPGLGTLELAATGLLIYVLARRWRARRSAARAGQSAMAG